MVRRSRADAWCGVCVLLAILLWLMVCRLPLDASNHCPFAYDNNAECTFECNFARETESEGECLFRWFLLTCELMRNGSCTIFRIWRRAFCYWNSCVLMMNYRRLTFILFRFFSSLVAFALFCFWMENSKWCGLRQADTPFEMWFQLGWPKRMVFGHYPKTKESYKNARVRWLVAEMS